MKKSTFAVTIAALALVACTNMEGLTKDSAREPKGNANAAVTVREFADLQCPACRAAHTEIVPQLLEKYGNTIRYEHMHFPLRSIHRYALEASLASECAADQGKFWEYVDVAFTKQPEMDLENIRLWAEEAGVSDMDLFDRCYKSQIKKETILADYNEGKAKGVRGTPTFEVNGELVETDLTKISEAIEAATQGAAQRL